MLTQGIIKPSFSPYTNPLVVVKKPGTNKLCLCLDGKAVVQYVIKDYTGPETIESLLIRFQNCNFITIFDLTAGFRQIDQSSIKSLFILRAFG